MLKYGEQGKVERRHFGVWNICLERDDTVKASSRFLCLQWDIWIVTMIQKWQTRRQTKAVIKSVDYTRDISLKVIRSLLNRSPWKIIFAPPGFWRQIKPLKTFSIKEKGRYIVLKGVTYSISREDKQQKKTQAWMKEKKNKSMFRS